MKFPSHVLLAAAAFAAPGLVRGQTAIAAGSPPSAASNAAPLKLDAVRVTADLWESPLERMPASVTVYDDAALRTRAVQHFGDLVDQIPNLTWTGGTSRPRYFQIRSIGENSQFEGETPDSSVRFLIDDLDFTGLGMLATAFDVSQVEVLRGPQAGAFGANAAGGLVRLVTNEPTSYVTGQVEGTLGEGGLRAGGVAVGGPLSRAHPEFLMARIAVHRLVSDGFQRNVTLDQDANARDELSARLRLTLNPAPQWRWEGSLLYSEIKNGYDEWALDNNGSRTFSDQPGRDAQESLAASLRGTFTGHPGVRLTTITAGTSVESAYSYDDDWTSASYRGFSDLRRERNVFSQELRLDSAVTRGALGWIDRWTLGAYFSRTDEFTAYTNEDPENLRGLQTSYDARNYAAFGQVGHDVNPRTRLIVGLRAELLDLEGGGTRTRWRKVRGTFDPEATFRPRFDDTLIGGKITLERDLSDREMAFVSVTRGYKGGGVNVDARINPPDDPLTYATEYLWNYEAGVRGNWLERRVLAELTAFHLQRFDTQVRDSAGFGGSYRFFTANAERAKAYGLEAAGSFVLTDRWSLFGSLGLLGSRLDRFQLANGNTGGGRRLANTPEHGYNAGVRYRSRTGWFGQLETVGRARHFDSNNHDEVRRAFQVFNATLGYTSGNWTITVWGRNLSDEVYDKRVFFFGNEEPDYLTKRYESHADPRQFGVTASFRF